MAAPSLAERLGQDIDAKIVVVHVDDVGMCHGANMAFADLHGAGFVTCGSVMVPCPWFLETADMAAKRPELDLGVHLTLTSERDFYRWRPLTGTARSTGLVDEDGYMWRTAREVRAHAQPEAVEAELRAQIDAALAAGIEPTHLDCHMATAFAPEFIQIYLRLGADYGIPLFYPKTWDGDAAQGFGSDPALYAEVKAELGRRCNPIFDAGLETPWVPSAESAAAYQRMLDRIEPGLTFLSLHPNRPGDIEAIDPLRAHCRTDEWRLFQTEGFLDAVEGTGMVRIGFREIAGVMARH